MGRHGDRPAARGLDRTEPLLVLLVVLSSFMGGSCARTCLDTAPDDGMIEQPLPGVTPSPTPPPTTPPPTTPPPTTPPPTPSASPST